MQGILTVVLVSIAFVSAPAFAHGDAKHDKKPAKPISTEERDFGREGDPDRSFAHGQNRHERQDALHAGQPHRQARTKP